jgi:hypothetical protein
VEHQCNLISRIGAVEVCSDATGVKVVDYESGRTSWRSLRGVTLGPPLPRRRFRRAPPPPFPRAARPARRFRTFAAPSSPRAAAALAASRYTLAPMLLGDVYQSGDRTGAKIAFHGVPCRLNHRV